MSNYANNNWMSATPAINTLSLSGIRSMIPTFKAAL